MSGFVARRILIAIPTLVGVAIVSFLLIHLVPGDPVQVMLGTKASPEAVAEARSTIGLDDPLWQQFGNYLSGIPTGDLGESIVQRRPVVDILYEAAGPTLLLLAYALALTMLVLPLGVLAAVYRDRLPDHLIRIVTLVAFTLPPFWFALILIRTLSVDAGWFPASGYGEGFLGHLESLTLPAITLAVVLAALLVRMLRSSMTEQLDSEYVVAGRARGLAPRILIFKHAQRNALLPIVTVTALAIGWLIGIAVVVETVFAIPGLGRLLVTSVADRDLPVIQGITLLLGAIVVISNLLADLAYGKIDPRVRVR